jgi:hypothetical protein
MQYLLDTVTLIRHFTGTGKIGHVAAQILNSVEDCEHLLVISVVSLKDSDGGGLRMNPSYLKSM